jgi:hypothetical protein
MRLAVSKAQPSQLDRLFPNAPSYLEMTRDFGLFDIGSVMDLQELKGVSQEVTSEIANFTYVDQ